MRRMLAAILAVLFPALLGACASAPEGEGAPVALEVAPLEYTVRELPNGLRVYAMPDANTANVSVQVWYAVGSKDDPLGRSGFAHLFEHIMFKSTANMPAEFFDRLTEDVGGFNNASTYDDFTNYYEVVPANHLERILWAEAERMGSLVVDEATFDSERDVVKEELRQRVLAQPYGRLFYLYLPQANYTVHPYGRPGIGSIEDLDAATVEDVRAFHAAYYRPDNAVLVVAGNFDPADLNRWVDQYFGPIARPDRPIPRVTAQEPARVAPRDLTVYEPNTPLPAVMITYPGPDARHPDLPALIVLDAILSKGESSRLYQSLVYEQQIAAQAFTFFEPTQDPSAYAIAAILSEGQGAAEGVAALSAEIARLRDGEVAAAELDEAKNEIVTETIEGRETAFGRATELANAVIRFGDPAYADRLLADIQAVTAADVQRVARAWFNDSRRVVIRYLPEETQNGAPEDVIQVSPTIAAQNILIAQSEIPVHTLAPEATRMRPPEPAAPVAARLPTPVERTLANGLRVIVAERRDLPLISADLRVLSGESADAAGRAGQASLTADILTKGTRTRSATDIARQIESLGASLSAAAGRDSSSVSLQARSDRVNDAFAIFADVAQNPTFAEEELERQRQQNLDGLSVALRQPGSIAQFAMRRALFGAAPYGGVASPASLQAITQADVQGFHAAHYRPDNAVLVIAGDVSAREGFALAERFFGGWARPATPPPPEPAANAWAADPRAIVINLPDSGQAAIAFGFRGPARTDADYFPALVATNVLGGGYSARLNMEIRIRRGLSYGVGANLASTMAPGPIIASGQTRNDAAPQVVDLMSAEFARLGAEDVPLAELNARKAVLIGGFGRSVETTSGVASQLSTLALFGIPLDRLNTYVADVGAVSPQQVRAAGARLFDPAAADLVVVGDASLFAEALRQRRANLERVELDQLNLDKPELR